MTSKKSPSGIQVRKVAFEYPEDMPKRFHPEKPQWSHVVNGSSMLMPFLEPYLVDTIRKAIPKIKDADLRAEAEGYVGQESQHFKNHRIFNKKLMALGYQSLEKWEDEAQASYDGLTEKKSLEFNLAYAAGFETMALAVAHMLVKHRRYFFEGADPAVSSLVLWHFVEELEHKNAAFDVYQDVVGKYPLRVWGLVYCMVHSMRLVRRSYKEMMEIDGTWGTLRNRWELKKVLGNLLRWSAPILLKSLSPWHHPSDETDPEWVDEWVRIYDEGERGVLQLDTSKMALTPAQMLPPAPATA